MTALRRATWDDLPVITDIYNEAVMTTTATFDLVPKQAAEQRAWFEKHGDRHPIFVATDNNAIAGWISLSPWSDRCAYDGTVETSFYVASRARGQGLGTQLLAHNLQAARTLGYHTVLARIAAGSDASLHLHRKCGFTAVGCLRQVGRKFDRWLDVHILQLMLKT